jgi:hypothetical protein
MPAARVTVGGRSAIVLQSGRRTRSPSRVAGAGKSGDVPVTDSTVAENLAILVVLAALAGAFVLVLLNSLWRIESRAHWSREAGIERSRRLERRVFLIGVSLVLVMGAVVVVIQLTRPPSCTGRIVTLKGPQGAPMECVCEQGRRGICFPAGP